MQGELAAERRQAERLAAERAQREQRIARLRARRAADMELEPRARRIAAALASVAEGAETLLAELEEQLSRDHAAGEEVAAELRACAHEEAEIQARLRALGEAVTAAEVAAQRLRDQAAEAAEELSAIAERLERPLPSQDDEEAQPEHAQPLPPEEARRCRRACSACCADASSSAPSTRSPRRSTPRRSPTSRSSRPGARTWRPRCASWGP